MSIGRINVSLGARTSQFDRAMDRSAKRARSFEKTIEKSARRNKLTAGPSPKQFESTRRGADATSTSFFKMAGAAGAASIAIMGLQKAGSLLSAGFGRSIQLASEAEQTQVAFEVLLKSGAKAKALIGDIRGFAAESPLALGTTSQISKQLLSYRVAQDKIVPKMKMLGDLSMGQTEQFGRLAYAYGQVRSAGRLYGTELRQFTETGIPIIEALSTTLGIQSDEVKQYVESGKVSFLDLDNAMKGMTGPGGQFFGMTERQGKTLMGMKNQFIDAAEQIGREFGAVLIDEMDLKGRVGSSTDWLRSFKSNIQSMRPTIRFFVDRFEMMYKHLKLMGRTFADIGTLLMAPFRRLGITISDIGLLLNMPLRILNRIWESVSKITRLFMRVGMSITEALIPAGKFEISISAAADQIDRFIERLLSFDEVKLANGLFDIAKSMAFVFGTGMNYAVDFGETVYTWIIKPFQELLVFVGSLGDMLASAVGPLRDMAKYALMVANPIKAAVQIGAGMFSGKFDVGFDAGSFQRQRDKELARLQNEQSTDPLTRIFAKLQGQDFATNMTSAVNSARDTLIPRLKTERVIRGLNVFGDAIFGLVGSIKIENQAVLESAKFLMRTFGFMEKVVRNDGVAAIKPETDKFARQQAKEFDDRLTLGQPFKDMGAFAAMQAREGIQSIIGGFGINAARMGAKQLNPNLGFGEHAAKLLEAKQFGQIDDKVFNASLVKAFRSHTNDVLVQENRLPSASVLGSSDFAATQARAFAGTPDNSPAALLQRLAELLKKQTEQESKESADILKAIKGLARPVELEAR